MKDKKKQIDHTKIASIFGSTYEPLNGRTPMRAFVDMKSKSAKKRKKGRKVS